MLAHHHTFTFAYSTPSFLQGSWRSTFLLSALRLAFKMAYTERNRSASPPLLPVSKSDRRRRQLQDKLADMVTNFSKDRDQHYRAQLHALQVDMNLIVRADAYADSPLDDDPDTIRELVRDITGGSLPQNPAALQDFLAMAGRGYQDFARQINKAQEERDAALTMLWVRISNSLSRSLLV